MEDSDATPGSQPASGGTVLTLEQLLVSESEVLKRVARQQLQASTSASGHYSSTSGHNMGGSHSSHTMAKVELPMEAVSRDAKE